MTKNILYSGNFFVGQRKYRFWYLLADGYQRIEIRYIPWITKNL